MFVLAEPTRPEWLAQAVANLDTVLIDHAHCEKKAAHNAMKLMYRYPERKDLVRALVPLAQEELQHLDWVNRKLDQRGLRWAHLSAPPYGQWLGEQVRRREPGQLLDSLLVSGLIEARSHERLALLAGAVADADLVELYVKLAVAEERHHHLFYELACCYFPEAEVQARLQELAQAESQVLRTLHPHPRVHS